MVCPARARLHQLNGQLKVEVLLGEAREDTNLSASQRQGLGFGVNI